jgi:molybdopterin-biosynthesis enzyme MoeA-like protein
VEIVCVGRDLVRGRTPISNAHEIAAFLSQRGAAVRRITIVDDTDRAICEAVTEALTRNARLVVTVGGLGPMTDDRTLGAVSDALKVPLALHARARDLVEAAYRRLHDEGLVSKNGLTAAREKMCSIPIGSEPVPNEVGVAPGVVARLAGGSGVLCLPGTPAEMRAVLAAAVPHLKDLMPRGVVARRDVETPTNDESALRPLLDTLSREFPSVWIQSHAPGFDAEDARVRVCLEAGAADKQEAEALVEDAVRRLIALAASG